MIQETETSGLAKVVQAQSLTEAWLAASEYLRDAGREAFGLMVEVTSPDSPQTLRDPVRAHLDRYLAGLPDQSIETVAGTIFPATYYRKGDAARLFATYELNWPLIRDLHRSNSGGTYFRRLTHLETIDRNGNRVRLNPLAHIIDKIRGQLRTRGPYRTVYPLSIYQPGLDRKKVLSFPCMTFLDLKIDGRRLHLTAQYRNQMYTTKAYGNLVGLADLQDFVARETGLEVGHILCLATHAQLDQKVTGVKRLLSECRALLMESERMEAPESVRPPNLVHPSDSS